VCAVQRRQEPGDGCRLTDREACKLVLASRGNLQAPYLPDLPDLILVALNTGMHRGELLGLE
jgi:hypothetical protein